MGDDNETNGTKDLNQDRFLDGQVITAGEVISSEAPSSSIGDFKQEKDSGSLERVETSVDSTLTENANENSISTKTEQTTPSDENIEGRSLITGTSPSRSDYTSIDGGGDEARLERQPKARPAFKVQMSKFQLNSEDIETLAFNEDSPLMRHQQEALKSIVKHLDSNQGRKATAVLPTGTGKTVIALVLPYLLKSTRALVITPRISLRHQIMDASTRSCETKREAMLTKLFQVPLECLPTVSCCKNKNDLHSTHLQAEWVVSNAQMFTNRTGSPLGDWQENIPADNFDLVIVDEAHFHPSATWANICNHFQKNVKCKVVFFTATPMRADRKPVCDSDEIAYQYSRSDAVKDGIIRGVSSHMLSFDSTEEKEIEDDAYNSLDEELEDPCEVSTEEEEGENEASISGGRKPTKMRSMSNMDEEEPPMSKLVKLKHLKVLRAVCDKLKSNDELYPLPGGRKHKALVMVGNRNCRELSEIEEIASLDPAMKEFHIKGYYSGMDHRGHRLCSRERDWILSRFKENGNSTPRVLLVKDMLREGFDHNSISVIGISRSLKGESPTFQQFVGRGVRTFRDEEPKGLLTTVVWHCHDKLGPLFDAYLNDRGFPSAADNGQNPKTRVKKV